MRELFHRLISVSLFRIALGLALFITALLFDLFSLSVPAILIYILALAVSGLGVFLDAARGIARRDFMDEKLLMCIASVGAMIIGEYREAVAVMLFFLVGEYFEQRATRRARESIRALMEICPDTARVVSSGEEVEMDAEDVEVGDIILVRPGERVAVDAVVIEGRAELDTSALSGEAEPRVAEVGDYIDSGSVVLGSPVLARAVRVAESSRAARTLSLVEEASDRKAKEESFITAFSRYYTPIVIVLALLMAVVPPVFGLLLWRDAIYRALSFLVVSCPCALVISVPMAFFGGIGGAASLGVLYKGGNVFSTVASVRRIVFDKTGTLTTGEFTISKIKSSALDAEYLLAAVASLEENSSHPIARGITRATEKRLEVQNAREIVGRGVCGRVDSLELAVGNAKMMTELGIPHSRLDEGANVYIAVNGCYEGAIWLEDTVKSEAASALSLLRRLGVKTTYILSGDKRESVENVGSVLGIDEVHSALMPEDKYRLLGEIISAGGHGTLYVGDGINDAPCLALADVGIAMGERGTDSAIETADVVIMSDNLLRIADAIRIARRTVRIAKQNIAFAIGIKLLALLLVALNLAGMWLAVFADVGVAFLAILNSMRTLVSQKKP